MTGAICTCNAHRCDQAIYGSRSWQAVQHCCLQRQVRAKGRSGFFPVVFRPVGSCSHRPHTRPRRSRRFQRHQSCIAHIVLIFLCRATPHYVFCRSNSSRRCTHENCRFERRLLHETPYVCWAGCTLARNMQRSAGQAVQHCWSAGHSRQPSTYGKEKAVCCWAGYATLLGCWAGYATLLVCWALRAKH